MPDNLIGNVFGNWTVISEGSKKNNVLHWFCRCNCGTEKEVSGYHLVKGNSTKCPKCQGREKSTRTVSTRTGACGGFSWKTTIDRRYKWTELVIQDQFDKQKGICPVCEKPLPEDQSFWAWDHNHTTGETRALLHRGCNVFIGRIENDPNIIERATKYLKDYER